MKNRSGTTSVVIVDKSSGKFRELKAIGVSSFPEEIADLKSESCSGLGDTMGNNALKISFNILCLC